jgi:hypothetical protein
MPLWQKLGALVLLVAVVLFVALDWSRFLADFWPVDHSNVGPNLVASVVQWALILIVAALLWPPTRRRIHRFVDRKADSIKQHARGLHDEAAADRAELLRHVQHVIKHHPTIPDLPPKE